MSSSSNEASQDACQISKQQQKERVAIPQIEVVNEIQIIINKKENQRSFKTTPSDNKNIKTCISNTDLTNVTTPTTTTTETTAKNVRRRNSRDKDKSGSICVCGKILKRVKGLLEKKEKGGAGKRKELMMIRRLNDWCIIEKRKKKILIY